MQTSSRLAGVFCIAFLYSGIAAPQSATPGTPRTAAFQVNQSTITTLYINQSVGSDDAGNLTIAWADNRRVWARRFGPNGAPLTGEIGVSTAVAPALAPLTNVPPVGLLDEHTPAVAVNRTNGDFIVGWIDDGGGPFPLPPGVVLVRLFDRNGLPKGAPIVVTATPDRFPEQLYLSMNSSGAFMVAWTDRDRLNYGPPFAINLAWYDGNGQKQGATQLSDPNNAFFLISAGISRDGNMMLAWYYYSNPTVFGDCFTARGVSTGAVTLANALVGQTANALVGQTEDGNILLLQGDAGGVYQRTYDEDCRQVAGDILLPGSVALGSAQRLAIDSVHNQLAVFGWQYQQLPDLTYRASGYLGLYSLSGTAYGAVQPLADLVNDHATGADTPELAFGGQGNLWASWVWKVWHPATQTWDAPLIRARGYYGGATALP